MNEPTNRERVITEAMARWPSVGAPRDSMGVARENFRMGSHNGFIAGRTVSAEHVEDAAEAMRKHGTLGLIDLPDDEFECCVREAFTAAGFIVED